MFFMYLANSQHMVEVFPSPKLPWFQLYCCYRTKSKTREVKIWKLPWFYTIQMSFCSMFMRNIRLWKGPINEKTHFSYRFQGWLVTSMLWFPSTSKLLKQKQWYVFHLNEAQWPKIHQKCWEQFTHSKDANLPHGVYMFSQINRIPDLMRKFWAKRCGLYVSVYGNWFY